MHHNQTTESQDQIKILKAANKKRKNGTIRTRNNNLLITDLSSDTIENRR